MKKILILAFILLISTQFCLAEDETIEDINQYFSTDNEQTQEFQGGVEYNETGSLEEADGIYLEDNVLYKKINLSEPKKITPDRLNLDAKKPNLTPFGEHLNKASAFYGQEYDLGNDNFALSQKFGKFSVGTKYNTSLNDDAQINYTTAVFSKYEGKHFAFTTTFLKSTGYDYANYKDRIQIAPELKITKRLSILNIMKTDIQQINKSNEIVLRYKPNFKKYADDVELEFGAGQSFYNDVFTKSTVRFSTNFKL